MNEYTAPVNEFGWQPIYSICEETGLRVCDYYDSWLVREDGLVRNVSGHPHAKKYWHDGCNVLGYRECGIPKTNRCKPIHRILAFAFLPNPDAKPYINHINCIKNDNRLENLEWCTQKENIEHSYANGLKETLKGALHPSARKIGRFSKRGKLLETYHGGNKIMIEQGYTPTNVSACCRGRIKHHKGFIWKYLD